MRSRLAIILTAVVVLALLVVVNAASYVRPEREPDLEFRPRRSTTNAGATGTRALYEFLQQTGRKVVRWTGPPSALLNNRENGPTTFVVIGQLRAPYKPDEASAVLRWVSEGGRLVVIDRRFDELLVPSSDGWRVSAEVFDYPDMDSRPDDRERMTAGVRTVAPAEPTLLTRDVDTVLASRFAARLQIFPVHQSSVYHTAPTGFGAPRDADEEARVQDGDEIFWGEDEPPPPPRPIDEAQHDSAPRAPVRHISDWRAMGEGSLLVDYEYGRGRIVLLSDPYIVSNAGIKNADNLQLATNVVAGANGAIAFDEYHQGLGATGSTGALALFRGTPVLWLFAQAGIVALAFLWSRGRRFARPLPAPRVDRRSKLEFVASMAELQQRSRAYDLAVENVYGRTRRALARYAGLEPHASIEEIAVRVAARSAKDPAEIQSLLAECEASLGEESSRPTARRAVGLTRRLRELERDLGIRMRAREIRQMTRK